MNILKTALRGVFSTLGYSIQRKEPELMGVCAMADIRRLLKDIDSPVCFDVGANVGQTIESLLEKMPKCKIHSFEPGADAFSSLEEKYHACSQVKLNNVAVSDKDEMVSFYQSRFSDLSSCLPMSEDHKTLLDSEVHVRSITLQHYLESEGIDRVDLLKIDTQGYDLHVLKGAQKALESGRIGLILFEVLFHNIYEGAGELDELYRYMKSCNCSLVSFYHPRFRDGKLRCMDALFVSDLKH